MELLKDNSIFNTKWVQFTGYSKYTTVDANMSHLCQGKDCELQNFFLKKDCVYNNANG